MKSGFVLLEVLLASAIAAMIGVALFNGFFQINKFAGYVDDYVDIYQKAALVQHQLERDIQGAFVPLQAQQEDKDDKQKKDAADTEKKQSPLKNVFVGQNKDGNLELLTFITSNPLTVHWSDTAGSAKPRIVRVVYRVEQDAVQKNAYKLLRQEANELNFDKFKPDIDKAIRSYEIADEIRDITVEYLLEIEQKEEGKEKKKEYKTFKVWSSDNQEELEKRGQRKIPHAVKITVSFWNRNQTQTKKFDSTIDIYADPAPIKKRVVQKPAIPKPKQQPDINQNVVTGGVVVNGKTDTPEDRERREQRRREMEKRIEEIRRNAVNRRRSGISLRDQIQHERERLLREFGVRRGAYG